MSFQIVLLITAALLSVPTLYAVMPGSRHGADRSSFIARHFRGLSLVAIAVWALCLELQFWAEYSAWQLAISLIGVTGVAAALVLRAGALHRDEDEAAR